MELFVQQLLSGLATGAIYACMALAVVMIYQAIDHVNFAQGEMATFSTFVAWQLLQWGVPYWIAFLAVLILSFLAGVAIERAVFKPLVRAPALSNVVAFIGLMWIFNSLAGFIWSFDTKSFPSPFDWLPSSSYLSSHQCGMMLVTVLILAGLYLFFQHTRIGLAMRASAGDPVSSRLVGVRVGWMVALGWGMASAIGAIAGMMIAPVVYLEPNMMLGILLYGFAGAVLGGMNSVGGAVVGGLAVGVIENMASTYIPVIGGELKFAIALAVIVTVLLFKPAGLFGRPVARRV